MAMVPPSTGRGSVFKECTSFPHPSLESKSPGVRGDHTLGGKLVTRVQLCFFLSGRWKRTKKRWCRAVAPSAGAKGLPAALGGGPWNWFLDHRAFLPLVGSGHH